jgi:hypothetical protein
MRKKNTEMNVVMIIPTGIGCEIGGHCGDGNAPARLLGACCDHLVLHPNVVNASDINEMPENTLYVEGNHLDRFLQGKLFLQKVKSNKVLVVVNKADYQSINAVSAARTTIGLDAEKNGHENQSALGPLGAGADRVHPQQTVRLEYHGQSVHKGGLR